MAVLELRYLLVFAALVGLAGPVAALPAAAALSVDASSTMSGDCMEMMADREDSKPLTCDGSFKCMLAMGCLSLNMIAEASCVTDKGLVPARMEFWPSVAILRGTTFAPELDPPTPFG